MKPIYWAVALILSGCATTPTTEIAAFGDSASAVTEKIDAVIAEYNQAALDREFTSYAATYDAKHASFLTREELANITKPISSNQQKGFAIYQANRALGGYAKALAGLAAAGNRADLDFAVANLYGSMSRLNQQYKTLTDSESSFFDAKQFADISTLVAAIGATIIEEKRREAIKGIVIGADKKIALICDTINEQLEKVKLEDSIAASRQYILTEELKDYKAHLQDDSALDWRREQIKRLYHLQQAVFNSKLLVQQTKRAVSAIKAAHALLATELEAGRFNGAEIAVTIGRLSALKKHYTDFDEFLLTCNKVTKNRQGILSCDD